MDESTGSPSRAHMALLYGPRTEQELAAALVPFLQRSGEYRRRFAEDGIALTQDEAVKAYRLMAPLYAPDMTDEEAERQSALDAIAVPCHGGGFVFRKDAVKAILEGFEREIAEGSQTLYFLHAGEAEPRPVDSWERFRAYQALKLFVEVMDAFLRARVPTDDFVPFGDMEAFWLLHGQRIEAFVRARAILDKLTVKRPRGRFNPTLTNRRNLYIVTMLCELAECGLPVTSSYDDSLAGALAEALDGSVRKATIAKVWEGFPFRSARFNDALPAEWRMPESLTRRGRERFAPDVPCVRCGKAEIPKYRADGSRLCLRCNPPDDDP